MRTMYRGPHETRHEEHRYLHPPDNENWQLTPFACPQWLPYFSCQIIITSYNLPQAPALAPLSPVPSAVLPVPPPCPVAIAGRGPRCTAEPVAE